MKQPSFSWDGAPTPPDSPSPLDPLAVACTYRGDRYHLPCRATAGEPCRWMRVAPDPPFHAERRVAAGEALPRYEDLHGADAVEEEPEAEEDDDEPSADASG